MGDEPGTKQHRVVKREEQRESDLKTKREDALKLGKQLEKKKYSRPIDDVYLDDFAQIFTSMGMGEKFFPIGTTTSVKFHPLFGTDEQKSGEMDSIITTRLQCITALQKYEMNSLEELRLSDHLAGYRYRGEPTGRSSFKRTKMKKTDLNDEWTQTGTYEVGFEAVVDEETDKEGEMDVDYTTLYQSITVMFEYETKSFEELRLEDYLCRLPRRKNHAGFDLHSSKNWHETLKGLPAKLSGTEVHEFKTYIERDYALNREVTMERRSMPDYSSQDWKHQCITRMSEYKNYSLEELRLMDYLSGRRGPRGPMYKVSEEELMRLQVNDGLEVIVFIKNGIVELKEKGTVKFIGRSPEKVFGKVYVGLELNRAIGNGDGRIKGIRLFQTKENHAKFVPLETVFPANMFDEFNDADDESMANEVNETSSQNISGLFGNQRCVVCFSKPVEIFFSPCGHACCCEQCTGMVSDCPVCRQRISEKKRVFLP